MKRAIYIGVTQDKPGWPFLNYGMTGDATESDAFYRLSGNEPCRLFSPDGGKKEILVHTKDLYLGGNAA